MEFVKKILNKKPNESVESTSPPPYEFNDIKKVPEFEKTQAVISRKYLKELSSEYSNGQFIKLSEILQQMIEKSIEEAIIKIIISVITSRVPLSSNYEIEKETSKSNYSNNKKNNRGFCSVTHIAIYVNDDQNKNGLIDLISNQDYVKNYSIIPEKITDVSKFKMLHTNDDHRKKIMDKYGLNDEEPFNYFVMFYNYENLQYSANTKFVELYDNMITKSDIVTKLQDELVKVATSGCNSYKYKDDKAEAYYEYLKYYKIFSDLDISVKDNELILSWN